MYQESKQSFHQRQRNLLYLMSQYLIDFGLKRSQAALLEEANLTNDWRVCDNIDLDTIYLDYCSYYQLRFGKQPKVLKKNDTTSSEPQISGKSKSLKGITKQRLSESRSNTNVTVDSERCAEPIPLADMISVSSIGIGRAYSVADVRDTLLAGKKCRLREDFLENLSPEMKELAEVIQRFVLKFYIYIKANDLCFFFFCTEISSIAITTLNGQMCRATTRPN